MVRSARLTLLASCAALVAVLALVPPGVGVAAETTFVPVADAFVDEARPSGKFGSRTALRMSAVVGSRQRSYLRFDVQGLDGPVTKAMLRLSPNTTNRAYSLYRVADTTWSEATITWATAPPMGSLVGAATTAADGWTEVDVTEIVAGNGLISAGLDTGSGTVTVASRETGARAPRLVVTTSTSAADTSPPAVTLVNPADGSSTADATPLFSGAAGTAAGDSSTVTVSVYGGTAVSGSPVLTASATRSDGSWSVEAGSALAAGTYTARAEQVDGAGNVGRSSANTFTVSASAPSSAYRDAVMSDAPRAYWRLDEASGTTAASVTGTDPATYQNGVVLGRPGALSTESNAAVSLDGVDDQIRAASSSTLSPTLGLSLEAWVKPAALPSASATIVRKDLQYLLRLTSSGALNLRLWKAGVANELVTPSGVVQAGAWSHVVASWDGSTMAVYVNGVQRASKALGAPIDSATTSFYLGSSGGYDWINGSLDEVAIYATGLSATRIQSHYKAAGGVASGPSVQLDAPATNSVMDAAPNFGGRGGTALDDSKSVTVKIYSGSTASGSPVQTLTAAVRSIGTFSVKTSAPLATGTYTAQAEQTNSAGGIGRSAAKTFSVDAEAPPVLLLAGDIVGCSTLGDEATAAVLDTLPGTIASVGDHVYEYATTSDFTNCYDATWGRHKARTRPIPGDHEYEQPGAGPYFDYFGAAAGERPNGYYSYDIGSWHIVALNTNCFAVPGGCAKGSAQEQWLRSDLAANATRCTLAYTANPRFSSGQIHGSDPEMTDLWQALYDHGAEVVVSGDDHVYERFAPQTPQGAADPARGIRQFVAGTGGRSHYAFGTIRPNSEVRNNDSFGILKLSLRADGYDWRFVPEAGKTFSDSGSQSCH